MRWFLVLAMLAATGCGKSFQEADAIYKDELKKLEELREESRVEYDHAIEIASKEFERTHKNYSESRADIAKQWNRDNPFDFSAQESAYNKALKAFDEEHGLKVKNGQVADAGDASADDLDERRRMVEAFQRRLEDALEDHAEKRNAFVDEKSKKAMDLYLEENRKMAEDTARKIRENRKPIIAAQQERVDRAYKAKEAAK